MPEKDLPYILAKFDGDKLKKQVDKPYDLYHVDIHALCSFVAEYLRQNPKFLEDAKKFHSKG